MDSIAVPLTLSYDACSEIKRSLARVRAEGLHPNVDLEKSAENTVSLLGIWVYRKDPGLRVIAAGGPKPYPERGVQLAVTTLFHERGAEVMRRVRPYRQVICKQEPEVHFNFGEEKAFTNYLTALREIMTKEKQSGKKNLRSRRPTSTF
jgi:hypothetical protein